MLYFPDLLRRPARYTDAIPKAAHIEVTFVLLYPLDMPCRSVPAADRDLVQIVDTALADVTRRSGAWLVCRPGCTPCCIGPFPINQLDAARLRQGLDDLDKRDPNRAARLRQRVRESAARISKDFPGDPLTGILHEGHEAERRFANFANDEPCPVLDPDTGTCDLYQSRPMTCRVFGPPIRSEGGLGVCELCFHGATPEEIAACELDPHSDELENSLVADVEQSSGVTGDTIVAFCLAK
jgi:Fe-S-cluster containining protein